LINFEGRGLPQPLFYINTFMDIPIKILEIDSKGYHLLIEARVNELKANVLIDTGASRTLIDLNRLSYYEVDQRLQEYNKFCTGVGTDLLKSFLTYIDSFSLGNKTLVNLEVIALDLDNLNKNYAVFDLPRIDLVLGSDILLRLGAVIDYPARFIRLAE